MLRCPPSRIHLTPSDLNGLDQRLVARRSARLSGTNVSNVRLSPGPGHPTRLSVVTAERNVGRERAASSSSEATFHTSHGGQSEEVLQVPVVSNSADASILDPSTSVQLPSTTRSTIYNEATRALETVAPQRKSPVKSTAGRHNADSLKPLDRIPKSHNDGRDEGLTEQTLDGSLELRTSQLSLRSPGDDISYADVRLIRREYPAELRARRQVPRTDDIPMPIYNDPEDLQDFIYQRHTERPELRGQEAVRAPPPVPELIFATEVIIQSSPNLILDPGAPVFVPRTRFGSATESYAEGSSAVFLEPPWVGGAGTNNPTNLRIRPSSEQNIENPTRPRFYPPLRNMDAEATHNARFTIQERRRRTSRNTDQNTAIHTSAPNLERYPVIGTNSRRPPSGLTFLDTSFVPPTISHQTHTPATTATQQLSSHAGYPLLSSDEATGARGHSARSVSPTVSVSSQSTPNLLQAPASASWMESRASSLSWSQRTSSFHRVPSMVSAASGVSGGTPVDRQTSRHSSREGLNAAAEFLRMRNSPLDDLTERLSRLSSSRPRSIGRSWERRPQSGPRASLLTGDPFKQESSPSDHLPSEHTALSEHVSDPVEHSTIEEESEIEDTVALSLALPPSSPPPASLQAMQSTPPHPSESLSSPRAVLAQKSPVKAASSPESAIKRKPVPHSASTSKVPVYDDRRSPDTQPQTPADLPTRSRRAKTRSDTTVQQSPIIVGRAMIGSPAPIPERHSHRNTYPPHPSPQTGQANTVESGHGATAAPEPVRQNPARRRAQTHRSSEQAENDLEGQLSDLEHDRRTWLSRRARGTMDVTPPKEGRFERYYHEP